MARTKVYTVAISWNPYASSDVAVIPTAPRVRARVSRSPASVYMRQAIAIIQMRKKVQAA